MNRIATFLREYPLARGMLTYSILWPTGCALQQLITDEPTDWKKKVRFGIYGAFITAPTLYGWIKLSTAMWPHTNLKTALIKTGVEQISYGPFACVLFLFGMSMLEQKTYEQSCQEVKKKFLPVFTTGLCYWPVVQTINFSLIKERNRVPFVSVASLLWTIYLAYVNQQQVVEGNFLMRFLTSDHRI